MPLMTPRGLKIRLELPWAFSLLHRLWSKDRRTDAFRVLKTCEAIESVPSVLAYLAAMVAAFIPGLPTWSIFVAIVVAKVVGKLMTEFGLYVLIRPIGLLHAALALSWISGYGILFVSAFALIWIARGWLGILYWIAGGFCSELSLFSISPCIER